jgi:hypothetical protein
MTMLGSRADTERAAAATAATAAPAEPPAGTPSRGEAAPASEPPAASEITDEDIPF